MDETAPLLSTEAAPVPVAIVAPAPIPVVVTGGSPVSDKPGVQQQATDPSKAATTTFQEDLSAARHGNINLMWEGTQKNVTLLVTVVVLGVSTYLVVAGPTELQIAAFTLLSSTFSLVVGTYFQRTNHTKSSSTLEASR